MTMDDTQSSIARISMRVVITALLYVAAGRLALLMAIPPGYATAVWPAAGIALVCCLVWERPVVAGVAVGSFLVNVSTSFDSSTVGTTLRSIGVAATIGLGAAGQAALGAALIRRFVAFPTPLESIRDIARFTLLGGPLSCTVAASTGVTTLCSAGVVPWSNFAFSWWTWWVGDAIGVLIFGPLCLLLGTSSPSRRWRDRTSIVGLPLLVGFGLVTLLFLRASTWERLRLWTEFERRAATLSSALETKLSEYQAVVGDTAGLLEVVPDLNRASFGQYTQRVLSQHPGMDRLGWTPADSLEPEAEHRAALGFDFSSDPVRREALELARRSGRVTASARLSLVQGPSHEPGVLLVAPVFSRGAADSRASAGLRGYAVGAFVVSDMIGAALKKLEHDDFAISLVDKTDADHAVILYAGVARDDGVAHRWSHTLSVGGRRWSIELRATPQYMVAHRSWQAWMVLAGGLLFVALLEVVMLIATGRTAVLRESAERFGALVEASAQIVWTASAVGDVVEDSASWRDFTGQTVKQSHGLGWLDALHPDDRPQVERLWHEAIVSGKPLHTEYRIRHANGGWRWTAARAVPLLEDAGVVRGWVGMNSDITEQKRTAEQFRVAIEAAPTGMLMVDRNGTIRMVNQEIERMFGYARNELIGMQVEALVPARGRGDHSQYRTGFDDRAMAARSMASGRDLFGMRKDGSEVPIEIGLTPIRVGDADLVLSSVVDISERKRAAEQFRLAIEASPTGMLMTDRAGQIVLLNQRVETLFGYARDELLGKPIETLVPERMREGHPEKRQAFFAAPQVRPMGRGLELYGLCKDGSEVPVEIALTPLHTGDGEFVLSSVVDNRERKRAERERELLLQRLQAFNVQLEERVQARTQELSAALREREVMLQEIHHRVKNNLQVISSLINMQMRSVSEPRSREALEECKMRVHAIALIHETLYQSHDYAHVPFSDYARSLTSQVFRTAGLTTHNVRLEFSVDDIAFPVDRAIPCGLLLNELVTNALKYAFPDGRSGSIRVEFSRLEGNRLRLAVRDDGVGLPPSFDAAKSGSLGMQLVTTLAEQLHAHLDIRSNAGASFELTFEAA